MFLVPLTQPWFGIDRLKAHEPHKPLDPLAVDLEGLALEKFQHPPRPIEGRLEVLLVDFPHQLQVQLALTDGLVVEGASAQTAEFALPPNADICIMFNP
jgi:hypothetical protein